MVINMKYLSKEDIEKIAGRVFSAYMKLPNIKGERIYRVEPEILLRDLLNIKLEFHHLSLDGTVLGLTASSENYVLLYDATDAPYYCHIDENDVFVEIEMKNDISQSGRYNFTVAHEAGHKIFQKLFPEEYCDKPFSGSLHYSKAVTSKTDNATKWIEWQANALASALLILVFCFQVGNSVKTICSRKAFTRNSTARKRIINAQRSSESVNYNTPPSIIRRFQPI